MSSTSWVHLLWLSRLLARCMVVQQLQFLSVDLDTTLCMGIRMHSTFDAQGDCLHDRLTYMVKPRILERNTCNYLSYSYWYQCASLHRDPTCRTVSHNIYTIHAVDSGSMQTGVGLLDASFGEREIHIYFLSPKLEYIQLLQEELWAHCYV